jgi:two-component system, OmpR family, phosphate regulon response regulator PhoB
MSVNYVQHAKSHILIVEDEPAVAALVATTLRLAGYEVTVAQNAAQALAALGSRVFHAMVVDWMMPAMSGIELIAALRQNTQHRGLPILMLTAKAQEHDTVQGLEAGADDYLSKPFSPRELVARVKALLRRAQPLLDETAIAFGVIRLNPATAVVTAVIKYVTHTVDLSHTEFKLLHCLMLQPRRVHSRESLLAQAWDNAAHVDARTIDAHIKRLRQALLAAGCADYIHTVRGMGYSLSAV